ncbi:MAG: hypothetical protein B6U69_03770 [Thermofilum sp. ex4484_15]|nr:MAG: hypothetical protein B6U69_03770 [Thermofilum sp. ex4484_15]
MRGGLRRLGKVLHVSQSGRIIVRAEVIAPLYAPVYDRHLREVGRVCDVLGPVSSPYVAVEPIRSLIGSIRKNDYLFVKENNIFRHKGK